METNDALTDDYSQVKSASDDGERKESVDNLEDKRKGILKCRVVSRTEREIRSYQSK